MKKIRRSKKNSSNTKLLFLSVILIVLFGLVYFINRTSLGYKSNAASNNSDEYCWGGKKWGSSSYSDELCCYGSKDAYICDAPNVLLQFDLQYVFSCNSKELKITKLNDPKYKCTRVSDLRNLRNKPIIKSNNDHKRIPKSFAPTTDRNNSDISPKTTPPKTTPPFLITYPTSIPDKIVSAELVKKEDDHYVIEMIQYNSGIKTSFTTDVYILTTISDECFKTNAERLDLRKARITIKKISNNSIAIKLEDSFTGKIFLNITIYYNGGENIKAVSTYSTVDNIKTRACFIFE